MTPAARLSAAIEVIADIEARRRPAADALKDWGLAHRFAGSSDRAAIAGLVYDTLRRKSSSAWLMGEATPARRAASACCIASAVWMSRQIAALMQRRRALRPQPLTEAERGGARRRCACCERRRQSCGDYPEWLDPHFARVFGEERAAEGAALASRAPLDLRVNTLKAERDEIAAEARAS